MKKLNAWMQMLLALFVIAAGCVAFFLLAEIVATYDANPTVKVIALFGIVQVVWVLASVKGSIAIE